MKRLGDWQPEGVQERLDRVESVEAIRQLVSRYAFAIDSRDIDTLVELFEPEVAVGPDARGRAALHAWFVQLLGRFGTSVHFVGNHVIDFHDSNHADGYVYTHDELDRHAVDRWDVGKVLYKDRYRRIDGEWYFERRNFMRWYLVDWQTRPAPGAGLDDPELKPRPRQMPHALTSWSRFWSDDPEGS